MSHLLPLYPDPNSIEFQKLVDHIAQYAEEIMDQWENFSIDTNRGLVYVYIGGISLDENTPNVKKSEESVSFI